MRVFIAAATTAVIIGVIPSLAQAQTATGPYVDLGYANAHSSASDLGAVAGRVGYRANSWLGVEGEAAYGVKGDEVTSAGVSGRAKLRSEAAIYGVGYAPLSPNTDLFARVGYGSTRVKVSVLGASAVADGDSWNFGVGAQHHFDRANGVRADYTRQEFRGKSVHANVFSLAYVRRF